MNSSDTWCKIASLLCCLVLGIEVFVFIHDIAVQARCVEGTSVANETPKSTAIEVATKVAVN